MKKIILLFMLIISAGSLLFSLDLKPFYTVIHPKEKWGEVIISFKKLPAPVTYGDRVLSAWAVSVWKKTDNTFRKLRDGLFGTYTAAAVMEKEGRELLVWYSPEADEFRFNKIINSGLNGSIYIGSEDPGDDDNSVHNTFRHYEGPDFPEEQDKILLEGIYDYYHSSTGRVFVRFGESDAQIVLEDESAIQAYSLSVVREVPGFGYAFVKEGLYGGSGENDSFTLAGVQYIRGEPWIVWTNPAKPDQYRRNRITTLYTGGDIGIGLYQGEDKYIENTLFRKTAGPEAAVGSYRGFIKPEGLYLLSLNDGQKDIPVSISRTGIISERDNEKSPVFRIDSLQFENGNPAGTVNGLFEGDVFRHLSLHTENGKGILVWYAFSMQCMEEHTIYDAEADGSFKFGTEKTGGLLPVGSFRKIESAGQAVRENPANQQSIDLSRQDTLTLTEEIAPFKFSEKTAGAWTKTELETISSLAQSLPDDFSGSREIILEKKEELFVLGESGNSLIEISGSRKKLQISSFGTAELYSGDQDFYHSNYLKRMLIFNLGKYYYRALDRHQKQEWKDFSLWKNDFIFFERAQNINPLGFASETGMISDELDFASFAMEFFFPPAYKDPLSYVKYRLPGRYRFFQNLFSSHPDPNPDSNNAPDFRDWINPADVEHIEILITTPTTSSPASIAGHTLLLIKRKDDYHDGRDSTVLGFVGETSLDKSNGISGITYAWRGITGHYRSLVMEEKLDDLIERAIILENRDVMRLKLLLDPEQIEKLIERMWVIKNSYTFKYRFFDENCADMLFDVINYTLPPGQKITMNVPVVAPMLVVAKLLHAKKLGEFIYPEHWSIAKKALDATRKNRQLMKEILKILRKILNTVPESEKSVYREAETLFNACFYKGKTYIGTDPLFREAVLVTDTGSRSLAYEQLSLLFMRIYSSHVQASTQEYYQLAEKLIRFFMNADSREMYTAVPDDIRENYHSNDPIPSDIREELIEEQMLEVQLRQKNSKEMQSLRLSISRLRNFIDKLYPDSELHIIGRTMQEELTAGIQISRENTPVTHGYYPDFLTFGYLRRETRNFVFAELGSAVFSAKMGHNSIFSLKPDMKMIILDAGYRLRMDIDSDPFRLEEGNTYVETFGTAFEIEKVFVSESADYQGILNHGFGFLLLQSESVIWNGEVIFPGVNSKSRVMEAKYILNIFESGSFLNYLNLKAGAAYEYERISGITSHFLTLPAEIEAKLHLGGNYDNVLRLSCLLDSSSSFSDSWYFNLNAKASIVLGSSAKPDNYLIILGADFNLDFSLLNDTMFPGTPRLKAYLKLKN